MKFALIWKHNRNKHLFRAILFVCSLSLCDINFTTVIVTKWKNDTQVFLGIVIYVYVNSV